MQISPLRILSMRIVHTGRRILESARGIVRITSHAKEHRESPPLAFAFSLFFMRSVLYRQFVGEFVIFVGRMEHDLMTGPAEEHPRYRGLHGAEVVRMNDLGFRAVTAGAWSLNGVRAFG